MSRRVIVVALVLGALTTWIIAGVLASAVPDTPMVSGAARGEAPTWAFRQWRTFGRVSNNYSPCFDTWHIAAYEGPKPALVSWWSQMHRRPAKADFKEGELGVVWFNETGMGWPLAAFVTKAKYDGRVRGAGNFEVAESGSFEWEQKGWTLVVPYRPIWAGFAVNVVVFSGMGLLVLGGPGGAEAMAATEAGRL